MPVYFFTGIYRIFISFGEKNMKKGKRKGGVIRKKRKKGRGKGVKREEKTKGEELGKNSILQEEKRYIFTNI